MSFMPAIGVQSKRLVVNMDSSLAWHLMGTLRAWRLVSAHFLGPTMIEPGVWLVNMYLKVNKGKLHFSYHNGNSSAKLETFF